MVNVVVGNFLAKIAVRFGLPKNSYEFTTGIFNLF